MPFKFATLGLPIVVLVLVVVGVALVVKALSLDIGFLFNVSIHAYQLFIRISSS